MLNALRSAAGTWAAKLLLIILVVSFGIWGVTGRLAQVAGGTDRVIAAGDTKVTATQFRLAYNRRLAQLSQQFGTQLTPEQGQALGIEDQVISQLVASAVLGEQARKLGLGVSEDRIADQTATDPAFRGSDGRFDRQRFDYMLNELRMNQRDYFQTRERDAARQQIVEAVADGVAAPDAFLKALSLYRGEDRTVDYLVLPKSLVDPIEEPAADKLSAFFADHKADYTAPEYRKIATVKLEAEDLADDKTIAEEDVRKQYDASQARYGTPETRTIEQIVFPDADKAKDALAGIKGGAPFEKVVADQGRSMADVQLGSLPRDKMADKAVADAAFALPPNQVSDVVNGAFGPVLLRVTAVTPAKVQAFGEVSGAIRHEMALAEARSALTGTRDAFEDARASGATLREAAGRLKLKVATVDAVDRKGLRPDGAIVKDLPASEDLIAGAFGAEQNTENDPIETPSGGFVFYDVEGVTAERERSLDEVKAKVAADWKAAEEKSRLAARAAELEKQVKDGAKTLDALATELKLEKQTKRGLKRGAEDADLGPSGVQAAFGVAEGAVGLVPTGDGQFLFKVTETAAPLDAGPDTVGDHARKQYAAGMSSDLLDQLISRLQGQVEVTVNRDLASRSLQF